MHDATSARGSNSLVMTATLRVCSGNDNKEQQEAYEVRKAAADEYANNKSGREVIRKQGGSEVEGGRPESR